MIMFHTQLESFDQVSENALNTLKARRWSKYVLKSGKVELGILLPKKMRGWVQGALLLDQRPAGRGGARAETCQPV